MKSGFIDKDTGKELSFSELETHIIGTRFHEAGHAVAVIVQELTLNRVSIIPGEVDYRFCRGDIGSQVIVGLAGLLAQIQLAPETLQADLVRCRYIVRHPKFRDSYDFELVSDYPQEWLEIMEDITRKMLRRPSVVYAINKLVEELSYFELDELDGREATDIIEKALRTRKRDRVVCSECIHERKFQ